jgi:O-antigen ligase
LERAFAIAIILYYAGMATAILYPELGGTDFAEVQGTLHIPIVLTQAALYGIGGCLILTRWRRVFGAARFVWPLVALTGWAMVSTLWSEVPFVTLRRCVLLAAVVLVGIYLGEKYDTESFACLTAGALSVAAVLPLVFFAVASRYVVDPDHPGSWRGLAEQKNAFGMQMALGALLLLFIRFHRLKPLRYLLLLMASGEMILSHSMTSVGAFGLVLLTIPFLFAARLRQRQRILAYIASAFVLAIIAIVFIAFYRQLFELLGRDTTLTGRTQVWSALLTAIAHRPLLGYGFSSFWTGLRGESLDLMIASGWVVPEAHNGYLELVLGLGPLGAILFVISLGYFVRNGLEYFTCHRDAASLWPLAFLSYYLFHNLAESDLMNNGAFLGWTLYVTLSTSLALHHHRLRRTVVRPIRLAVSRKFVALVSE